MFGHGLPLKTRPLISTAALTPIHVGLAPGTGEDWAGGRPGALWPGGTVLASLAPTSISRHPGMMRES